MVIRRLRILLRRQQSFERLLLGVIGLEHQLHTLHLRIGRHPPGIVLRPRQRMAAGSKFHQHVLVDAAAHAVRRPQVRQIQSGLSTEGRAEQAQGGEESRREGEADECLIRYPHRSGGMWVAIKKILTSQIENRLRPLA